MRFCVFGSNWRAGFFGMALAISASSFSFAAGPNHETMEGVVRLVTLGDEIVFSPNNLKLPSNARTVEWSQGLSTRKAEYLHTVATITTKGVEEVTSIFVQGDYLDKLLSKCGVGHDDYCSMAVGEDFQYGQNRTNSLRFLVFHDKKSKPYMHRFVDGKFKFEVYESGKALAGQLNRKSLIKSVMFTAGQYPSTKVKWAFGDDKYLSELNSRSTSDRTKQIVEKLSIWENLGFIKSKSAWCKIQVAKVFGEPTTYGDGTPSNPGQLYYNRCESWRRNAWLYAGVTPRQTATREAFGQTYFKYDYCMKSGGGQAANIEVCEVTRATELLEMGANPSLGYTFKSNRELDQFFDSEVWRLKQ